MNNAPSSSESAAVELAPRTTPFHWLEGKEGFVWLVCAGLLLLTGVLKSINLVIVLAYLLIALWLMNLVLARWPVRRLSAFRSAIPPLIAKQPAEWHLEVANANPLQGYWILEEHIGPVERSWLVPPYQHLIRVRMVATFAARGRYALAPLWASCGYPFGLCRRSVELLPAGEVLVQPNPARVDAELLQAWLLRRQEGREDERRRVRRVVEREADVHGLRDYRPGDTIRRIHWKATARRNKLTVREYEDSLPPRLTVFVELWLPARIDAADLQRVEDAVSLVAGIIREWRREAGGRFALIIAAQEPVAFDGPLSATLATEMLNALAIVAGSQTPDFTPVLASISRPALTAPTLFVSTRPHSPLVAQATTAVAHTVAVADVSQPASWFRLPN